MKRDLPEQQAFTSRQQGTRQRSTRNATRQPVGDVITFTDSAGHLTETDEGDYDDQWTTRLPSSSRRYTPQVWQKGNVNYTLHPNQPIQRRRSAQATPQRQTEDTPVTRTRHKHRMHWLVYAGIGAIIALTLWICAAWVINWWTGVQNDWKYTATFRTFSVDQAVGHNGDSTTHPSHFIVQNNKRRIIIIEFPDNDESKALIYAGPVLLGDGQEKTPVTISFQANTQTGRLEMVLHVQDQSYIFSNNGTKFVPPAV